MMGDVDKWIEIAKECKYLPESDLKVLCEMVCDILMEESNIQPVSTPVTVCGDIHGQVASRLYRVGLSTPTRTGCFFAISPFFVVLVAVLRLGGTVSGRRSATRHQLHIPGRLCGPRLLQSGDLDQVADLEGKPNASRNIPGVVAEGN